MLLAKTVLDSTSDAILAVDARNRIGYFNATAERLFGYSRAEVLGRSVERLVPRGGDGATGGLSEPPALRLGEQEQRAVRKDGTTFPVALRVAERRHAGATLYIWVLQDITSRKIAESALRRSEARFRTLVSSMDDIVFTLDREGRHDGVFGRWLDREGMTLEHFFGKTSREILGPDAAQPHEEANARALAGESVMYEWSLEAPTGVRYFETSLAPILDPTNAVVGLVGVARETTEQKRLRSQLMVADRMASVGTLASGVAHEINNPLSAVIGNLELAVRQVDELVASAGEEPITEIREELKDAREAADRVAQIVRDLKIFARTETETRGPVNARHVLQSSVRMAWNEIRHRAKLVEEYDEVPLVEANEARLGQVFLNLIVNAAQAISEGRAKENEIRVSTRLDEGGRVVIEITDTGVGIPADVMPRLFTPFFTTKPVGVGTGLGLSICHRIVTSFGGEIVIDSREGRGTTVRVYLRQAAEEERPRSMAGLIAAAPTWRGRVLVIDDEAMVGATVRRALGRDHEVTVTTRAEDAIEMVASGTRFDLILCDLMMPQVTGMEVHERLTQIAPDQAERMVFLTGGAFTPRARAFLDKMPGRVVDKPFDVTRLRAVASEWVARAANSTGSATPV